MTVYHQRSCSMQPIIMIPDDNMSGIIAGIQHAPKICVDYLSHEWTKEDDIWTSWKVMSKQKKEMANGIRLENASWRTWAKQKYNLKTVNPKDLNWLKDSDVTWLYGPLHTAWSESPKLQNNTEDKLHLMPSAKSKSKSCLKKKKSMTEILRPIVRGRYGSLVASNSDTQLYKRERLEIKESREREIDLDLSDCETASTCSSISGPTTPTTGPTKSILLPVEENVSNTNRKIQFNDRVEQCIAVESDDDTEDLNDSDSSDDGGIVLNKNKRRKDLSTICKLAPTKLKEDRIHNNEYSSLYSNYGKRRQNNQSSSSPSTSSSLPSTEASSSSSSKPWMMDEDDDELFMDSVMDFDDTLCYDNNNPSSSLSDTSNENNNDEDLGENQNDDYDEINGISDIVRGFIRSIF